MPNAPDLTHDTHATSDKPPPHDATVTAQHHLALTDTPALSLTAHIPHTSTSIIPSIPNNIANNQSNHNAPLLVPDDLAHEALALLLKKKLPRTIDTIHTPSLLSQDKTSTITNTD